MGYMLKEGCVWSEWVDYVSQICQDYFAMDGKTVEALLENNFSGDWESLKRNRLLKMFDAVLPYCEKYKDQTDEKIKQKVGQVFLKKLDYSAFGDEPTSFTYERLKKTFSQMDAKGINAYKMIYCQVLSDACIKKGYNYTRLYDENREFEKQYKMMFYGLKFQAEDIKEIYEKCSSLLTKTYPSKIRGVFDAVYDNCYFTADFQHCYRYFNFEEVQNIIKINPTLLCSNPDNVKSAFKYFLSKIAIYLKDNINDLPRLSEIDEQNFLEHKVKLVRNYLKNNSSLLTITTDTMLNKEKIIKRALGNTYASEFNKIFCDPINLCQLQQMPESKLAKNAFLNVQTLEIYVGKEATQKYLSENILLFAFDNRNFNLLLDSINREGELAKFLRLGKRLFAGDSDFKMGDIMAKIANNTTLEPIDVENLQGQECVLKFFEIFMPKEKELKDKLFKLISQKQQRNQIGEKVLRKNIRIVGFQINKLSAVLKDEQQSARAKNQKILKIAEDLQTITHQRLTLAEAEDISRAKQKELEVSNDIEFVLNEIRDGYNLLRGKIEKKYSGSAELFEKTMTYLDQCFDDKKAIPVLFKEEIASPFVELLSDNFAVKEQDQISVFGENNLQVSVNNTTLRGNLKKLSSQISSSDADLDSVFIRFEK